jgi:hypothetical protein
VAQVGTGFLTPYEWRLLGFLLLGLLFVLVFYRPPP